MAGRFHGSEELSVWCWAFEAGGRPDWVRSGWENDTRLFVVISCVCMFVEMGFCISGWPGTHCIVTADLEPLIFCLYLSARTWLSLFLREPDLMSQSAEPYPASFKLPFFLQRPSCPACSWLWLHQSLRLWRAGLFIILPSANRLTGAGRPKFRILFQSLRLTSHQMSQSSENVVLEPEEIDSFLIWIAMVNVVTCKWSWNERSMWVLESSAQIVEGKPLIWVSFDVSNLMCQVTLQLTFRLCDMCPSLF